MGVLGRHEELRYLPEDGSLVVQDLRDGRRYEDLTANDAHPIGTLGRSGCLDVPEVGSIVEWFGPPEGMTVDDITAWGIAHHRSPDWLDHPFYTGGRGAGWLLEVQERNPGVVTLSLRSNGH